MTGCQWEVALDSGNLREQVLRALPQNVRVLLDEIETFAGLQIGFRPNPYPVDPLNPAPEAAELEISADEAWIEPRATFTARDILHELLHLQRSWSRAFLNSSPRSKRVPTVASQRDRERYSTW